MANKSKQNAKHDSESSADKPEDARELTHDMADCLKQYAQANPGTAALWCLGIGFVLGWKLKPW
jgi:hypothetical protein